MPTYMASGGHYFGQSRYRFLILPRYDFDLHSIIRSRQVETKNILIIASQLIDILEHIHDCGYAHSDIKAENIMIGKCTYKKSADNSKNNRSKGVNATSQATVKGGNKRKPGRRLQMTLTTDVVENRRPAKRSNNNKSYAESRSSISIKSDDSDFSEDFEKLSDADDDDDDDNDDEDDEIDEDDDDDAEQEEDSGEIGNIKL